MSITFERSNGVSQIRNCSLETIKFFDPYDMKSFEPYGIRTYVEGRSIILEHSACEDYATIVEAEDKLKSLIKAAKKPEPLRDEIIEIPF